MNSNIRPIPYGLRREEVVIEVINSLEQLENLIETVFTVIDKKIESFGPTLSDINLRTANCTVKLNQLKTRGTRATKVFSSHKYPKTELIDDKNIQKSIFSEINGKIYSKAKSHSFSTDVNNNGKRFGQLIPFDDYLIEDKIKFFNACSGKKIKSNKVNAMFDRIGSIQWNRIHSLSSLLIFNTSEVAFISRSQKTVDIRQNQQKDQIDGRKRLDSAPKSMTTNIEDINEIHYLQSGTGPQLMDSLPVALPSLPGIADEFVTDDHNFSQIDSNTSDKNQTFLSNFLPVLPNFETLSINQTVFTENPQNISKSKETVLSKLTGQSSPPPPPPPPPPPFIVEQNNSVIQTNLTQISPPQPTSPQSVPIPPPPPVGPPPPPPILNVSVDSAKDMSSPKINVSSDNGRASLLESIRMAGGKPKAKTIKDKKLEKKKEMKEKQELGNTKATSSGGGDLMSDLMSRLALRRDGISGNQKAVPKQGSVQSKSEVSAMDRVSAMIPPPAQDSGNELSDPEDDWND